MKDLNVQQEQHVLGPKQSGEKIEDYFDNLNQ